MEIPRDINDLVDRIIARHEGVDAGAAGKRRMLSGKIEKFHREAGTYESVRKELGNLEDSILLWSGHQPNLFPYSGVMKKFTLMQVVKKLLEKKGHKAVCVFEFTDQAFPDTWVSESRLPSIKSRKGWLSLKNTDLVEEKSVFTDFLGSKVYQKYPVRINTVGKPAREVFGKWMDEIERWLLYSMKSAKTLAKNNGRKLVLNREIFSNYHEIKDLIKEAYDRSGNYSDFTGFLVSGIVNGVWGYETLFHRSSETVELFDEEIHYLLDNFDKYSEVTGNRGLPIWYHCQCGGKVLLEANGIDYRGKCVKCNREYDFTIDEIHDDFLKDTSLNALSLLLVYGKGLNIDMFAGGLGGLKNYYGEVEKLAGSLGIRFPEIAIWNPKDDYLGVGHAHALLEFVSNKSQSNRDKLNTIMDTNFSLIDLAINIGLSEVSDQWMRGLNGDLDKGFRLKSVVGNQDELLRLLE